MHYERCGDYNLARLLQQAADAMRRARQRERGGIGVSTIEAATLITIRDLGHQAKPSRIAECVVRQPNSMTALLQRMEQDGLVTRSHDLERKNWVRIELTAYGQEVLHRVSERTSVRSVFGSLPASERECLATALIHLRQRALALLGENAPALPQTETEQSSPDW
jgi:DNA-binding MarR family transcriptional regulator